MQAVHLLAVAVVHTPFEHVDELGSGVLKVRKNLTLVVNGDQKGLKGLGRTLVVGQQMVGVPAFGTPAHDFHARTLAHMLGGAALYAEIAEQHGE